MVAAGKLTATLRTVPEAAFWVLDMNVDLVDSTSSLPSVTFQIPVKPRTCWLSSMSNLRLASGGRPDSSLRSYPPKSPMDALSENISPTTFAHVGRDALHRIQLHDRARLQGRAVESTLFHTVEHTTTDGRLKRVAENICGEDDFFFSFGDRPSDANITELAALHRSHGKIAHVTAWLRRAAMDPSTSLTERTRHSRRNPEATLVLSTAAFYPVAEGVRLHRGQRNGFRGHTHAGSDGTQGRTGGEMAGQPMSTLTTCPLCNAFQLIAGANSRSLPLL